MAVLWRGPWDITVSKTMPWQFIDTPRACPTCGIPMLLERDVLRLSYQFVHGETPVACWSDRSFGDECDLDQMRWDWTEAVANAHWDRHYDWMD
jgi:hypothetical protein